MTTHPFDMLTLENGAQLIFTPCPGTKEATLVDAVSTLKQAGTEMLITLMFDEEMEKLSAQSLPKVCAENNIVWLQLPILDDAAPDQAFESQWNAHQKSILKIVNKKGSIAVHCKGGSGRTGLVIGLILAAYGYSADNVIEAVQKIRPNSLKNPTQLDYFNSQI